jgi:hypothetical protein
MLNVAVDVITEDWPEKIQKYAVVPGFVEHVKGDAPIR